MRVLVACEFSGIVRDAFRARGHDAWSVDLLPTEADPRWHYVGCAALCVEGWAHMFDPLNPWDLMVAHPPCTYLANSGVRWLFKHGKSNGERISTSNMNHERWIGMGAAVAFFQRLQDAPVYRIAIENPVPHRHANVGKPTQIIQPWQYGHGETKATCLWLKNLPKLQPTKVVDGRTPRVHYASPGPDRWKERSRTLQGIADAMADQWGSL